MPVMLMLLMPAGQLIVMLMLLVLVLAMLMPVITVVDDLLLLHGPTSWRARNTQIGLSTSLIPCLIHFSISRKSSVVVFNW